MKKYTLQSMKTSVKYTLQQDTSVVVWVFVLGKGVESGKIGR